MAYGQDITEEKDNFLPFTVFKSEGDSLSIASLVNKAYLFTTSDIHSEKANASNAYWVRADLATFLPLIESDSLWYMQTGSFYNITCYFQGENSIESKAFRPLNTKKKYFYYSTKDGIYFGAKNLIQGRYLFLKIRFYSSNENFNDLKLKLRTSAAKKIESNYYRWEDVVEAS